MTPGRPDRRVVDRHLVALRRALAALRWHAGVFRPSAEREIEDMLRQFKRREVARDDAVDALAAALTASAPAAALRTLPPRPQEDRARLPMEMVYVERGVN